jgi:sensor domain CHASE-containing protein
MDRERGRALQREAGAEIEVTEEMKRAGAKLLRDQFGQPMDAVTLETARDIYVAMREAAPLSRHLELRVPDTTP